MSTPKVTINVLSQQLSDEEREALVGGLHMAYMQATKGTGDSQTRWQWILFPTPVSALLGSDKPDAAKQNQFVYLERFQASKGNRSKWFHKYMERGQTDVLTSQMTALTTEGYTLGVGTQAAIVVPVELNDYVKVWNGETPQKAIRHIEYALRAYKITVK